MSPKARLLMFTGIALAVTISGLLIIGSKKQEYSTSVMINAHPSQIFPYLTQPDRMKQWMSGLVRVDEVIPPPDGYDPKPKLTRTVVDDAGVKTEYDDIVIRYTPDDIISVQSSTSTYVMTSICQLEKKESNGIKETSFTYQVKTSNVGLGRLIGPFLPDNVQSRIAEESQKLKQLVEKNEPPWEGEAQPEVPVNANSENSNSGNSNSKNANSENPNSEGSENDNPQYEVPNFSAPSGQQDGASVGDSTLIKEDSTPQ